MRLEIAKLLDELKYINRWETSWFDGDIDLTHKDKPIKITKQYGIIWNGVVISAYGSYISLNNNERKEISKAVEQCRKAKAKLKEATARSFLRKL